MSKIVVDAGHGGHDLGASFEGRAEKDDNLRLAQAVAGELRALGQDVIMTRDSDVFIPLADRARIANDANADLFISLHRNSFTSQKPWTNGVENWIYTTAPVSTENIAKEVLQAVVDVGVQADRGVKRGNYYVVRRTRMPSMLLEMGYINNEIDNQLFDEHLDAYAKAIATSAVSALGGGSKEPAPMPTTPATGSGSTADFQQFLNDRYAAGLNVDGIFGPNTKRAATTALQMELNLLHGAGLVVDGKFGAATAAAVPNVKEGDQGNIVKILQGLLVGNGYELGNIDGKFGPNTRAALQAYQSSHSLTADGIAGKDTFTSLLA